MPRHPPHEQRLGVGFTPLKALLLDLISDAGVPGISSRELRDRLDHRLTVSTIKTHVNQINDLLQATDYAVKQSVAGGWSLRKVRRE